MGSQEERREVFQSPEQLDWFLDLPLRPSGTNSNLLKLLWLQEGRRGLFQSQEPSPDLSLDLSEKLNGTKPNWNTLLRITEERREHFQSPEQLDWFPDLLLKLNGTNNKLLWLQEERRGLFQFQEPSPDLSLDLLEKLNGTKPNWNTLLSMVKNKKVLYSSCKIL